MGQISKLNFETIDSFFQKEAIVESCTVEWKGTKHRFNILRDDALHFAISGNKFRKLYGWLKSYAISDCASIESVGGAYSNHLSALAFACLELKIPLKVYVPIGSKSKMLDRMQVAGVTLEYVEREHFKTLRQKVKNEDSQAFWVPEGGKGDLANESFEQLKSTLMNFETKEVVVSAGTGSTAKAFAQLGVNTKALLAVKDVSVQGELEANGIEVFPSYEISKFGKLNQETLQFAAEFYNQSGILLDPIYQSKGLKFYMENGGVLNQNSLFVHTGGLQGWEGYRSDFERIFPEKLQKLVFDKFDAIFTT